MDKDVEKIYEILQKLVGLHRQLHDLVKAERTALEELQVKELQEITYNKEVVIHACKLAETERLAALAALGDRMHLPLVDYPLSKLVELLQGQDQKTAERFRSVANTLKVLLGRVADMNGDNRRLVEKSLEHVATMKRNVLGEAAPRSEIYTQKGMKADKGAGSRLLSKEI